MGFSLSYMNYINKKETCLKIPPKLGFFLSRYDIWLIYFLSFKFNGLFFIKDYVTNVIHIKNMNAYSCVPFGHRLIYTLNYGVARSIFLFFCFSFINVLIAQCKVYKF